MANNPRLKTHPLKSELAQVTPSADQDAAAVLSSPVDSPLKQKLLTLIANFYAFLSALNGLYVKNRALAQQQELLARALEAKMQFASDKKQIASVVINSLDLVELAKLHKQLAEIEAAIEKNAQLIKGLKQKIALLVAKEPELQRIIQTVTANVTTVLEQDSQVVTELLEDAQVQARFQGIFHNHQIYIPELPRLAQFHQAAAVEINGSLEQQITEIFEVEPIVSIIDPNTGISSPSVISSTENDSQETQTVSDNDNLADTSSAETTTQDRQRNPLLDKLLQLVLEYREARASTAFEDFLRASLSPDNHPKIHLIKQEMVDVLRFDARYQRPLADLPNVLSPVFTIGLQKRDSLELTGVNSINAQIKALKAELNTVEQAQFQLKKQQSALAFFLRPGSLKQPIDASVFSPTPRFTPDRTK